MTTQGKYQTYLYLGIAGVLVGIGIIFALRGRRKAVLLSKNLLGQTEVAGNAGFTNEEFQKMMREVGWSPGDPWCVYFAKLVWYKSAPEWLKPKVLSKVSGSSITTWNNLSNDKSFIVSSVPRAGDMAIWRMYSGGYPLDSGHAGIVKKLGMGTFTTVEGNANPSTASNEGYTVAEKTRPIDYTVKNGLRLVGFVRFA